MCPLLTSSARQQNSFSAQLARLQAQDNCILVSTLKEIGNKAFFFLNKKKQSILIPLHIIGRKISSELPFGKLMEGRHISEKKLKAAVLNVTFYIYRGMSTFAEFHLWVFATLQACARRT